MVRKKLATMTFYGLVVLAIDVWLGFGTSIQGFAGAQKSVPDSITLGSMRGLGGRSVELNAPDNGATALVFYSTECPISNAYSPSLNRLAAEFPAARVRFVGICVDPDLTLGDVAMHAKDFGFTFPVIHDRKGELSAKLGASVTPEAFVVDARGKIRYHGRVDDQFADRQKPNANPATHELRDAVAAVLNGKDVAAAHVEAVGCPLPVVAKPALAPSYSKDVATILQKNCQECHRKGQVGPFALETYEQARKRASDLASVAEERTMPPWKPAAGVGPRFKHDRSLSGADVAILSEWAEAGAPEGNPAETPPNPKFSEEWSLGTPDLVLEPSAEFSIPADGPDIYRCFVIPTSLPKDVYISAIEYRPGNRRVVHHMLAYVDTSGEARKKDAADPGLGYACFSGPEVEVAGDLGGWAPGNEPSRLPVGIGRALPKGSDTILQVHYHPSGKPETDRSRIGLHFARKPISQTLHVAAAANLRMELPAGQKDIEIKAKWPVPVDLVTYAVTPHMHLLGREILMSVTYADGRTEDLVKIPNWDFSWQNTYYFEEPLSLPKGSVLNVVAHFDNSETNPRNPNHPPKLVKWGEATTDEMCIGFVHVTKKGQNLTRPGEKDDLHDIFMKQREEGRKRYEEEAKRRAAEAKGGRRDPKN